MLMHANRSGNVTINAYFPLSVFGDYSELCCIASSVSAIVSLVVDGLTNIQPVLITSFMSYLNQAIFENKL